MKGHLPLVFAAELSRNETIFAEEHRDNYMVCLVTGISTGSPITICKMYRDIAKKTIGKTILYF